MHLGELNRNNRSRLDGRHQRYEVYKREKVNFSKRSGTTYRCVSVFYKQGRIFCGMKKKELCVVFRTMKEDIRCIFEQDPAARSTFEVVLTYSGLHAIWAHRIAHALFKMNLRFLARVVSQMSRFFTGIEIQPGAVIGKRLFIDHGMGIVIGETCEIGDDVTIYQGVTLGGTGKEKGKRHPTIKDNVLIATGAKVLGSITVHENSKIGAGSVVLKEVPPGSTVVGIPGRVVISNGVKVKDRLNHQDLPDPTMDRCDRLEKRVKELEEKLAKLEQSKD